jgi:hypothetical protein
MSKKVLIIGGVAAGAVPLLGLRRLDEDAEIIMFERGEFISFANCGLPYYVGGVIEQRQNCFCSHLNPCRKRFNMRFVSGTK